ncbi:gephyrin-like molybdotransferase Glp [Roseovarius dicentrarchi]|uniref:molybdopterin-binding protein n=1 Tax=Roseovarius dicentrarchi TaxID=2250573 RepID=UPI000DEB67D7|nr:gephyrin-like molybdotransferase Glp [Roseovarius dicentrarchi]
MTGFDSFLVVDWSASAAPAPARPSKDAIWLGLVQGGTPQDPLYCRTRTEAEARIADIIAGERAAGRRLLVGFDFPFGYPIGTARRITGSDDPLALWDWLEARITDSDTGANNRFDVAEAMNARFDDPGPFWGKTHADRWPGIPYRKAGIDYTEIAEKRACDVAAKAASSCFQLCFPPTVGSQMLMGLPMLSRLRRQHGARAWPFDDWQDAPTVLAEIWPGLIESAVTSALGAGAPIRDAVQVTLLARALSRLPAADLNAMMTDLPQAAQQEAWILGTGHESTLNDLAGDDAPPAPPPLRDDCFAMPAGVDWTPVDDALATLRAGLHPVVRPAHCNVPDACGRILSAPAIARRANPPTPNSAVDGYGFAHDSLPPGDPVLPLVSGRAAAGVPYDGTVPPGHAIRILTGAAVPAGVDTVILEEDTRTGAGQLAFRAGIKRGANTRKAGEDVDAGAELLPKGRVLTPADLALLAATGLGVVEVFERLRVAVISTGDELIEAGGAANPGQIYDANRPMLLAQIRAWGLEAVDMGRIPDDRAALRAALDDAASRADVILTSGGASAGDEDHVSALLSEAGAMQQWRIALKPGRPLALGLWQGAPVFGLPGNPVAALVCTLIFARPALGLLAGAGWQEPQVFHVPAAFEKSKKPGRREYLRARIRDGRAEVFASEGSGRISGLSWAEGLVELPDAAATIQAGDPVRYYPFGSFAF